MSRVYLLLRNNKQSGPHSLEELLKLGLKPLDLIWVDGKSAGWSYPSEVDTLKSYVDKVATEPSVTETVSASKPSSPSSNTAYMPPERPVPGNSDLQPSRKIYVSMPSRASAPVAMNKAPETSTLPPDAPDPDAPDVDAAKKLEQKAEELKKRIQSYTTENKPASAEELRKRIQSYTPETKPASTEEQKKRIQSHTQETKRVSTEEPIVTKYSSTLEDRAGEYSSWIYNKKTQEKKQSKKKALVIGAAALLILAAGFGVTRFASPKKEAIVSTPSAATAVADTPAQVTAGESETALVQPVEENSDKLPSGNSTPPADKSNIKTSPEKNRTISNAEPLKKPAKKVAPVVTPPVPEANKKSTAPKEVSKNIPAIKNQAKETPVRVAPAANKPAANKPDVNTTVKSEVEKKPITQPAKKKSLNEKVDAFFSRLSKKKEEAAPAEEPPATTNPASATKERKAVHRDDKAPAVTTPAPPPVANTNLADFVEVSTNKPSEDWMLGVHGLKVTVRNASKETVRTAEVELRYYSEQNEVLDKKIVNFSNIPPGKTITLPAPDHRLADHAEFKLIAVK